MIEGDMAANGAQWGGKHTINTHTHTGFTQRESLYHSGRSEERRVGKECFRPW